MDQRKCKRIHARLPFGVYHRACLLGHFWTRNISQEGLFLLTGPSVGFPSFGILDLHFTADGCDHHIRGVIIHRIPPLGVGIQLAYWRTGDRGSHAAYLQLCDCSKRSPFLAAA